MTSSGETRGLLDSTGSADYGGSSEQTPLVAEISSFPVLGTGNVVDQSPRDGSQQQAPDFMFPGWGTQENLENLDFTKMQPSRGLHPHKKLGEWEATAIAGNDITSSVLYVSGILAHTAGHFAPVCTLLVVVVLFLFRSIYGEVGSAMPLNGGTYNLLLNTTSKSIAAMAACLTILSYIATAVVSASEAMAYANNVVPVNTYVCTIALLYFFALLTFWGIKESAMVAFAIFVAHLFTMALLILFGVIYVLYSPDTLEENWRSPPERSTGLAIYLGFATAMLGVTGFETSSNYIEEQAPGVFQKTLRNMWVCVMLLNPTIAVLALGVCPQSVIQGRHSMDVLATMAKISAGHWFHIWVSVDAFFVLAGSVLTSYVGVTGLVRRMAMDRCFPQILMAENRWRHTNHWIILLFFLVTSSMFIVLRGDVESLAGVYTISFLSVMFLFGVGNIMLKVKRTRLKREVRASWVSVFIAMAAVLAALLGNVVLNPTQLKYFAIYFTLLVGTIFATIKRVSVLEGCYYVLRHLDGTCCECVSKTFAPMVRRALMQSRNRTVMFFTKDCDLEVLSRAANYVIENEDAANLKVTHCFETLATSQLVAELQKNLEVLDRIYPKLKIDLVMVQGDFSPSLVDQLSLHFQVPKNFMFIACPGDHFPHDIAALGGVRLITY